MLEAPADTRVCGEGYFLCRHRQSGAGIPGNPQGYHGGQSGCRYRWNSRIFTGLQALRWAVRKTFKAAVELIEKGGETPGGGRR
ncbi:MAG: hypothetical protein ACOX37_07700 [Bacillota bacterium]